MGARFIRAYFRLFTALGRFLGLGFVLVGAWGLITIGQQSPDERWLIAGVCLLVLLLGVGLLVARPATPEASERIFGHGLRKDSTDQRGPDEWQA